MHKLCQGLQFMVIVGSQKESKDRLVNNLFNFLKNAIDEDTGKLMENIAFLFCEATKNSLKIFFCAILIIFDENAFAENFHHRKSAKFMDQRKKFNFLKSQSTF